MDGSLDMTHNYYKYLYLYIYIFYIKNCVKQSAKSSKLHVYTCHVYMHTYVYTCKWETFQSTEKKKGDTWVFNISVNLNSTCICTIVQGDIKEISFFFFFFYISEVRTILDGILVYRVWGCWCVCTRLYWYKLNALL